MLLDERLAMDVVFQDDDSFDVDFGYVPNFTPYAGPYTVDPTQSAIVLQTLNKLASQNITINPIPSEYHDTSDATITSGDQMLAGVTSYGANGKVTGNIQTKTQSDLTVSGDTVTAPAGFYASNASASVAAGTEGTPVATKGTVSNHAIAVTPSVTNTEGYIAGGTKTGTAVSVSAAEVTSGTKTITQNDTGIDVTNFASVDVAVPSSTPTLQTLTKTYTATESQQTDTVTAGVGYDGIDEVDVTVNAIPSTYVGSGITRRSSSDMTASGDTVTAPAGYYESSSSKAVASGTEGTPTATKGAVSNHAITVTPSVTNTAGYISGGTKTGTGVSVSASEVTSGTKSITSNGSSIDVVNYASVDVSVLPNLQAKKSRTFTPNESVNIYDFGADLGYDGIDRVEITVDAISKDYVGSNVPRRSSSDMTASGATVTSPAGYYENASSKSVASGTAGTPTASKSAVSNHSVTVTPSVTNTTGYITGGTKTGTAVSVSASELVSGDVYINSAGTTDVTNVQTAYVSAGTEGTPTATKGAVSQHSITVTPSVTNEAGLISGGTKTGTPVTVSASELDSGTVYIDDDGDWNVVGVATASIPAGSVGTPTATKGAVSNHSVTVTPSVTHSAGWVGSGTKTGTGVSVTASELVSGNLPITQNGTGYDVANYSTVSVDVASGGGGFVDVVETLPNGGDFHKILGVDLSNDTVTAAHLEQGYTAHDATGAAILGTLVAGGGGLEYESGTWAPTADVANYEISFTNSHSTPPFFYAVADASGASNLTYTNFVMVYLDAYQLGGYGYPYGADTFRYSAITFLYRTSGTNSTYDLFRTSYPSDVAPAGNGYSQYWANSSRIRAYTNATSRYWRSTRTYKWIAVWMPT